MMEQILNSFSSAAAGRVVAIAAGNDNGIAIHKQASVAVNGSTTMTINVPTASGSSSTDVFELSIYANDASAVNAIVTVPGGATVTANAGQSVSPSVLSNAATVYLDNVVDAASGVRNITLYVARNATSANPSGTWTITLNNVSTNSLTIDGWLDYKGTNFGSTTLTGGDNNYLVGSPGTATNAITVASYMAKLDWYSTSTSAAGGYQYTSGQQDNISTFSSRGPRRDNVLKPDITANGQAVVSCISSDAGIGTTSNTIVVQGLYRAIQGTSMATPEVAGCIALLLQVKPSATFSEIRNAIATTATKDIFTTSSDNAIWGSGKIDVFKAASSLLFCKPSKRVTYSYDSSVTSSSNTTQALGSGKAATRFTPDITGKLGGVYFKTGSTVTLSSFAIEVRTNNNGVPGTLLGSLSISPSSVSRFSWNYYDVSTLNVSVTNGTDYFIVLVPGSSDSWALGYESLSVSGRSFISSGSSWTANNDLRIRSVVYDNTLPTSSSTTNISICTSALPFLWNGLTFNSAGLQTAHFTNSVGCDSAATLNLSVKTNYTLTASAGSNGNISPNGVSSVCSGSNITFTITPNSGYTITDVIVDGVSKGAINSFTFTNITANHSINASFSSLCLPSSYTMNVSICSGSSYSFNGNSYNTPGTYISHLTNAGGCDSAVTLNLSIISNITPAVSINTATSVVCVNSNVTFNAIAVNGGASPVYQWKKNGIIAGNGVSITFSPNTLTNNDVISCLLTANNTCQTTATANSNTIQMLVNTSPAIGVSTLQSSTLCTIGGTTAAYNSNTSGGGYWTTSNPLVATISTSNGASGIVTAVGNGTATLTYNKTSTNSCLSTASVILKVAAATTPNAITGNYSICPSNTTTLTSTTLGGIWSTASSSIASVDATTGLVTGNSAGVSVIKYTITNSSGCTATASYNITVNAKPGVPSIQYAAGTANPQTGAGGAFCANKIFTVVGNPSGGLWSSTGVLSVNATTGIVNTGNTVGAGNLIYTITVNGCKNSRTITGTVATCPGSRSIANNPSLENDYMIYPNPAKKIIHLYINTLIGDGKMTLNDIYGKQLKMQSVSIGDNSIDVSTFTKGCYFIHISTGDNKLVKKVIIE